MNKDSQLIAEAYVTILEAQKKKLTDKQKKIASAAPPYDKITKADIITLAKKKKDKKSLKEASAGIEDQEEEHCDAAADGCDCDGCNECIANQKTVKEDSMAHQFKVGDLVTLNHPHYPAMNGKKFSVQQVDDNRCDLVGVDQHGYSEPRHSVFWVGNQYLSPAS